MLMKLFKHEWMVLTKVLLPAMAVLLVITVFGCMFLGNLRTGTDSLLAQAFSALGLALYIITLIAITCGVYIYIIVRFYKTMYSDEGYLTHTLPLNVHQLIISKGAAASLWIMISTLITTVSVVILILSLIPASEYQNAQQDFRNLINSYNQASSVSIFWLVVLLVLSVIISSIYSFLFFSASMSIGQLFTRHKVLGSILAYFGIYTVLQIVIFVVMLATGFYSYMVLSSNFSTPDGIISYMFTIINISLITSVLTCVGFYYVTYHFTNKKLNLD